MLRLPAPLIDDWASVDWLYVAVLAVFVFFSTLIGVLLSFKRAFAQCLAVDLVVCGGLRILDLFPAWPAATDFGGGPEGAGLFCPPLQAVR